MWIEISRSVTLDRGAPDPMQKAVGYWETRGFVFDPMQGGKANGRRGNLWGNLTSFDMSRLMARLSIAIENDRVVCTMRVNTALQMITEWNRAFWELELATFESVLLHGDIQEDEWRDFDKAWKRAAWRWAVSGMRKGNRIHED